MYPSADQEALGDPVGREIVGRSTRRRPPLWPEEAIRLTLRTEPPGAAGAYCAEMDEPDERPDATPGVGLGVLVFLLFVGAWLFVLGFLLVASPWVTD